MTCTIDHTIPGTFPPFLCRWCHPELNRVRGLDERPLIKARAIPAPIKTEPPLPLPEKEKAPVKPASASSEIEPELTGVIVHKRPGIIAIILSLMQRREGATREEILVHLTKRFPERSADGMYNTIKMQTRKYVTRTETIPNRGKVYFMVVD